MQQELVYFQQKLDAFGIKLPKSMMDQVREDRLNNVGNRDQSRPTTEFFEGQLPRPEPPYIVLIEKASEVIQIPKSDFSIQSCHDVERGLFAIRLL